MRKSKRKRATPWYRRFWSLSGWGDESGTRDRWLGFLKAPPELRWALSGGKLLRWPRAGYRVNMDTKGPVEDFPWINDLVVSDRARQVLERAAPGQAEFYPVHIHCKGRKQPVGMYWVMNPVIMLDCAYKRTRRRGWINPRRVPKDVKIFRIASEQMSVMVRPSVREALEKAGLTGWSCSEFWPQPEAMRFGAEKPRSKRKRVSRAKRAKA